MLGAGPGDRLQITVAQAHDALGDALMLRDGRASALEIAGRGRTATQVVLAVRDPSAAGTVALAHAFLAAGAEQVIAALLPVTEAARAQITARLRGVPSSDLAGALTALQAHDREDFASHDDDRLGFAVFGRASCPTPHS